MTKGLELFTMMEGAHLEFDIQVDCGRGYVPAEVNERYLEIVGTIPMDCIFTPVPNILLNHAVLVSATIMTS